VLGGPQNRRDEDQREAHKHRKGDQMGAVRKGLRQGVSPAGWAMLPHGGPPARCNGARTATMFWRWGIR
jgi:hypothetical protein